MVFFFFVKIVHWSKCHLTGLSLKHCHLVWMGENDVDSVCLSLCELSICCMYFECLLIFMTRLAGNSFAYFLHRLKYNAYTTTLEARWFAITAFHLLMFHHICSVSFCGWTKHIHNMRCETKTETMAITF